MKFIHLSDLHIGKRVNEISMLEEQEYILKQILQIIDVEKPAAVLICGDVYDKSVPSAEAVTLFDDFLCRLQKRDMPTLIISGNHDSAERLAFGNRLMEHVGIHISPVYNGKVTPVTLTDALGQVHFWMLPFIKPAHVKRYYPDEQIESYTDAMGVAIEKMGINPQERNVLLTHQFITDAAVDPDGSEEFSVGGSENVDSSVFADFDYVALGHIHGPQNIGGTNRIRYCGTPLKYSFSEVEHHKSVTVVELQGKGDLTLHTSPLTPLHDMREIRGTFAGVTNPDFYRSTATEDYLRITLTDEEDVMDAAGKLRVIYPNLMELRYDNTRTRKNQSIDGPEDVQHKAPIELFEEFFQQQNNQPMTEEQRKFVQALLDEMQEGEA